MPIYEFKCEACEHGFELIIGVNAPGPRKCPECGKLRVKKVLFGSRPPVLHMRYSPMHPRAMRGQRRVPKRKR